MPDRSTASLLRRRGAAVLTAALVVGASAVAGISSLAQAAPTPTATVINVGDIFTPEFEVPVTPSSEGASYVVAGYEFTVEFSGNQVFSATKSTSLLLTVTSGPDAGDVAGSAVVEAGLTDGSFKGVVVASPANGVGLKVAVDARRTEVSPGSADVDVLKNSFFAPSDSKVTGFGGAGGAGVRCSPTPLDTICGDLQLSESDGVDSRQLLSQGSCDGLSCARRGGTSASVLQALVAVDPTVYNDKNPIEVLVKCDKTACGGGGIKNYKVDVQIRPNETPTESQPCASKGVIASGEFCTDYVQSKRDNAGDVILMVLLESDLKIIFR